MEYKINKTNFRDFNTVEINKLKPRNYFIPYPSLEMLSKVDTINERYKSPYVKVLNGKWDFVYYENENDLNDNFDTSGVKFDEINVPSTWQRTGYRNPVYLNQRYEYNPKLYPNMPKNVPLGVYKKEIEIDDINRDFIITFLGVMSSMDLYINGEFVGYSEGSHNMHEFNITKYLKEGKNEILVVVSKWSTGTYLECQDMFRENGIFRDVLLYMYPKTHIEKFQVKTIKKGSTYSLELDTQIVGDISNSKLEIELYDNHKLISNTTIKALNNNKTVLKDLIVEEWNAEVPKTYDLIITLNNGNNSQVIRNITGFKHIEIQKDLFYFNDKLIKLKGVNHHDTDMDNGYVRTAEQILDELELMKKFNINCIRTSHYPPDPILVSLCDLLGFYLILEADIETHGVYQCKIGATEHLISNDLRWENRYLDRVKRMYYRDLNHPSITMWSLGNEAGGYKCQDSCYKFLHEQSNIPVHYEGVIRSKRFAYDVISEMYPHHDHVESIGKKEESKKKFFEKPYFMCEYAHAMGVGPGAVKEYWDSIYKYDNLLGGCIWEWSDHAVHHTSNSKYKFTYGGDHQEEKHDKNFCVDGMLFPDKTPHTGCYVIGEVYRPIISKYLDNNEFKFTNTNSFKNANNYTVKYEILLDGKLIKEDILKLDINPLENKIYTIPFEFAGKDLFVNIKYYEKNILLATEQHIINNNLTFEIEDSKNNINLNIRDNFIEIPIDNGMVTFDKKIGLISYKKNNFEFINTEPKQVKGMTPNVCRASIDNDAFGFKKPWEKIKLNDAKILVKDCTINNYNSKIQIEFTYNVKRIVNYFTIKVTYSIYKNGKIHVKSSLTKTPFGSNEIQRFGELVELNTNLNHVKFYGRGNEEKMESLSDLNLHTTIGYFEKDVKDLHEDYVMPQDNTNITDCKMLEISSKEHSLLITSNKFSFSLHNYTQENLDKAKHQEDLIFNTLMLSIDGFMRGTGTNTCGEDTLEKYKVKTEKGLSYEFEFIGK